uniref:Uncharacterized protein n=1 Tax=Anguilla anguilla TaxID=7936 RepID=A0A0E9RMF0_ANGAN
MYILCHVSTLCQMILEFFCEEPLAFHLVIFSRKC